MLYTDGSSGVSGDGGWAAIVATPYFGIEISGWEENTTNNRMELIAAIEGLRLLDKPHRVHLVSDSAYLVNAVSNGWYHRWIEEGGRPNLDLWIQVAKLVKFHQVIPVKIKGHSGHEHNDRVDQLAVSARVTKLAKAEVLYGI